jgi:two-component system heavy metal sensor histidine kinase CusS
VADREWTLTGRMAVLFAVTTAVLLTLHAAWSAWFVYGALRADIRDFLDHEIQEFAHVLEDRQADGHSPQQVAEAMAAVTDDPACGFRVRDGDGALLAEAGDPRLLEAITGAVPVDQSWREHLLSDHLVVRAFPVQGGARMLEVLVDATEAVSRIRSYLLWAALVLLGALLLAGVSGWLTARRGLAGLLDVSSTAGSVPIPTQGQRLSLEGAPIEVRQVGEAFNDVLDRIDEDFGRMRTFTAGLAHELRAPLQNLIGETEVALLSRREPDQYEDLLRSNLAEMHELSDAVDNLVTWCRTASPDEPTPELEEFDLGEEARLRLSRDVRGAAAVGVTLTIDTEGDLRLLADREGCLRVVRNLAGNAVRWSPPGGTVRVRLTRDGEDVRLDVEDQGPGVPPEMAERIFEPFVSGRPNGPRRSGYGLGLSICEQVVTAHGGSLGFENMAGGGARFTARFPRGRAAA